MAKAQKKKKKKRKGGEQQGLRDLRGKEPTMFPFYMFDPSGQGRRRRRDTSSSASRKRARRERRDRDRRRRSSSSRGRDRERRGSRGRKRERESSRDVFPPAPPASAGYAWVQIPLPGAAATAQAVAPLPAASSQASTTQDAWWRKPSSWKRGESSHSWKGAGTDSWKKEKSWNKWVNPEIKRSHQQHKSSQGRREWQQEQPSQQAGQAPPPPPPPPEEEPLDRFDIKEATEEEELASAARKRQQEEESWHESLWREAVRAAVRDEARPLSARELVRAGKMRDWWSMSWRQCKDLVDSDVHDHYRTRLNEMFSASPDSKPPEAVVERFSAVCAYFQQCGIPLEHEQGIEMAVFKVPGQRVACIRTKHEGPSYSNPRNARFPMVASHGMPFPCAMGLAEHGELCPGDHVDGEFPQYGFSARGTCDDFNTESLKQSIGKVVSKAKGMGQIVATYEGTLERATPQTEGGMPYLSSACKDAGSSRAGDHLMLSPRFAVLRAISTSWPA